MATDRPRARTPVAAADGTVTVRVPGDKSISHRALLLAALAEGTSRLRGVLRAADPSSTAAALRALGVDVPDIPADGGEIAVRGVGLRGLRGEGIRLHCGNSGTTARLLAGMLSGSDARVTLDGDASLRCRPMDRVALPLRAMGARIDGESGDLRLPLRIDGTALIGIDYRSPVASAQVKSALLLAGVVAGVPVRVTEPWLSRDHTERMLAAMGAPLAVDSGEPPSVAVEPVERLEPLDLDVPGDPSSAAYFAALAALLPGGRVRLADICLNPTRTSFFRALARMGAEVEPQEAAADRAREPRGDVRVSAGTLRSIAIGAEEVPGLVDELPLLAVVASRAEGGETRIRGAGELRVKESDRIAATVAALRAVGADARELADGIVVRGGSRPLIGHVAVRGDHRLAMAFGVLGAVPGNRITIDDEAAVEVSYPGFWRELERVRERCVSA